MSKTKSNSSKHGRKSWYQAWKEVMVLACSLSSVTTLIIHLLILSNHFMHIIRTLVYKSYKQRISQWECTSIFVVIDSNSKWTHGNQPKLCIVSTTSSCMIRWQPNFVDLTCIVKTPANSNLLQAANVIPYAPNFVVVLHDALYW
jgi:hypothetical protein